LENKQIIAVAWYIQYMNTFIVSTLLLRLILYLNFSEGAGE